MLCDFIELDNVCTFVESCCSNFIIDLVFATTSGEMKQFRYLHTHSGRREKLLLISPSIIASRRLGGPVVGIDLLYRHNVRCFDAHMSGRWYLLQSWVTKGVSFVDQLLILDVRIKPW